ncbi:MAG: ABC transporter substrate-binding protein, partial [Planctomycetota bacterium]
MLFLLTVGLLSFLCGCERKASSVHHNEIIHNQRLRSQVQTLDPADIGDTASSGVGEEFFECLYGYHYLKRPHQLIPELAADMPQISEDGRIYRITIKRDVYYHNDPCFPDGQGRMLKAADFVYAWKRIADVKVRSKNWWIFDGRVVGLDDFREYSKTCKKGEIDYSRP